uniref:Uncharacterized protein n=1 Tax=Anguilla anguilla TaxID=7936 RepID=A0A0E9WAQ9_ANGAN
MPNTGTGIPFLVVFLHHLTLVKKGSDIK